uniref:Uncharacterized protein n=1 Tax=Ciona savignyi TaxID=51511 RepID=H2Y9F8_CIOSA
NKSEHANFLKAFLSRHWIPYGAILKLGSRSRECHLKRLVLFDFLLLNSTTGVVLLKVVSVLLVGRFGERLVAPKVGGQVAVGFRDRIEGGFGCEESCSLASSRGVAIFQTSHTKQFLGDGRRDNSCTTWCWDQTHMDTATFTMNLAWDSMGLSNFVAPISTTNWDDGKLSEGDGPTNSSCYFFGALNTQTNMSV